MDILGGMDSLLKINDMKYFCTLSDTNYLINGLTLYESINRNITSEFTLFYLTLDDNTFKVLSSLNNDKIIPININELEQEDDFEILKKNTNYIPNSHDCTYCFALGSYFTEFVARKFQVPHVLYVDSDIVFYENPNDIFDCIGEKSMGIMLHRHVSVGHHVGGYNVGVVYFKNNEVGYKCLKWWRDCTMDPTNSWFEQYGRVGDQVYLEGFEPLFGQDNVYVIDRSIGHAAPWNFRCYRYENDYIIWEGRKQKINFIHFSHFTPNYESNSYKVDRFGEWGHPQNINPKVNEYYDGYFERLKSTKLKYNL